MKNKLPILGLLDNWTYIGIFSTVFAGIFYFNYYLMANLPGERNLMCVLGAGLTRFNIIFAFLMSLLAGFVVVGFVQSLKNRSVGKGVNMKSTSTSIIGLGLGTLTTFCTFCSLPVISLFGFSVGLSFFTDYEIYFKVASIILLMGSFYYVNKELLKGCSRCVV